MPGVSYYSIWALFVYAWIANYLVRMALGALLPPIMGELTLTYTEAGFLSTAFFYAYMAMQFPAGVLGDRFGRKRMLIIGVLLGAVASVFTGLAGSFVALFLARALTGLSQGFMFSNDRVIIASVTPREKISLGQGVSFSGAGLGTTLGLMLAGALGVLMPWRQVFYVFALPPLLAALLIWRLAPEPPRQVSQADSAWPFRRVLRTPDFWLLGLAGIMPVYVQFVLATWAPLFFAELGITDLARSSSLASLQGLPAPFALMAAGLLADRIHRFGLNRKLVMVAALVCLSLCTMSMALVIRTGGAAWLLTALVLASSFFLWSSWVPAYAVFGEMFPPAILGKTFGLYNTICFLGAILGPLITGRVKDLTGSFAPALFLGGALVLVSAVLAFALRPAFRLAPSLAAPAGRVG